MTFAIVWEDNAQFGLESNLPHRSTREEDAFEDMLDLERYLSLQQVEEDLAEGEVGKRGRGTLPNTVTL